METQKHETEHNEFEQINQLYDECLVYLNDNKTDQSADPDYEIVQEKSDTVKTLFKVENEKSVESLESIISEPRSERLRKLSAQLPRIIITQSNNSLDARNDIVRKLEPRARGCDDVQKIRRGEVKAGGGGVQQAGGIEVTVRRNPFNHVPLKNKKRNNTGINNRAMKHDPLQRVRSGYGDFPKRLVSKTGLENIALISNVPFEKIRMLNDTFHTLINLRWRWIVIGTIVLHFAIWLVFALFWYFTALAHYDFEPDPPERTCITGGRDFVTIFLASVEAQTTIGFGDRAIDEECPESIFLFIMQLILGTGLSGVLTCVVYAKLTRPEKLSKDGVGFSKKAVISMRDGRLCLMIRAWDLNYDHIISSEFTAHFVNTHRTKEGEVIRYYARSMALQQRLFLLWPVTLVHVIDASSPLYGYTPDLITNNSYEITVSLKGASASMGTFTQSQTSYLPKEVAWGYRFPPVVKYDSYKQKYVIDHKKLDLIEHVETPYCCARDIYHSSPENPEPRRCASSPSSFSDKVAGFQLERSSSFRKKSSKA